LVLLFQREHKLLVEMDRYPSLGEADPGGSGGLAPQNTTQLKIETNPSFFKWRYLVIIKENAEFKGINHVIQSGAGWCGGGECENWEIKKYDKVVI
jgi:hypothetical protein